MTASRFAFAAAFVGFCTLSAFGQVPPPPPGANDPTAQGQSTDPGDKRQNQGNRNAPSDRSQADGSQSQGTPANGKAGPEGPEILDDSNATPEQKASAEYSGPAVLSRGITASEPMNPKNIKFTPSVGVQYTVDNGITGTGVQADGKLQNGYSQGVQLTYGITGEKVFRRDVFSLNFSGSVYHYAQQLQNGTDNQLAFTWRHKLSKHLSFGVRESFQQYDRNSILLTGPQAINSGVGTTLVTASPSTEAFDGRVVSLFTEGSVTWQLNARLSLNLSGAGFLTRRASDALFGDTGYQSGADVAYRITRRTTVGAYYSYMHFDYIGTYGGSDVNTAGLAYSVAFNPRTQLITRIGGSRLETTALQQVALDPFLALLFGTPSTIQATYSKSYVPDVNVQLRRKVSNLTVSLSYAQGVTPGNGVIQTSSRQSALAGVGYIARRNWKFDFSGGYDSLKGIGGATQSYQSVIAGASVSRQIVRRLSWQSRLDYHHYTFDDTGFLRNSFLFSTGVIWTPGDFLEHLW